MINIFDKYDVLNNLGRYENNFEFENLNETIKIFVTEYRPKDIKRAKETLSKFMHKIKDGFKLNILYYQNKGFVIHKNGKYELVIEFLNKSLFNSFMGNNKIIRKPKEEVFTFESEFKKELLVFKAKNKVKISPENGVFIIEHLFKYYDHPFQSDSVIYKS